MEASWEGCGMATPEMIVDNQIVDNRYLKLQYFLNTPVQPHEVFAEFQLSDDFANSQPLDLWKRTNVLSQMGENAILSRELYDLKP